jgi:hypothetical protein
MTSLALPAFTLELPDGLCPCADSPFTYEGPGGEIWRLEGLCLPSAGPEAQQALRRAELATRAVKDMKRDVCQPDLEVFLPLARAPGEAGLEVFTLLARSAQGRLLAQGVATGPGGVLKVVLDGRYERATLSRWFGLFESIRPAP